MFLGPEGSGNLALALAYAQYINCLQPQQEESCGNCSSCSKYQKLIHPDLHFTYPTISPHKVSKELIAPWREAVLENPYFNSYQWLQHLGAENKQGNITAEECREVIKGLSLKSFEATYKVHIIWMPEYLRNEGNILLKLLEEPPPGTVILLVAEHSEKILPTILSRTQLLKTDSISDEQIIEALTAHHQLEAQEAATIARLAEGNYNKALELIHHEQQDFLEIMRHWLNYCVAGKVHELFQWIDSFSGQGRETIKNFLSYNLHLLRESFLLKFGHENLVRLNPSELAFAQKFNVFLEGENLDKITTEINKSIGYIERNANPKITLINLSLYLNKWLRK